MRVPDLPPRAVGRPRDHEKRQAILDAGWRMFLAQGLGSVSIDAIARAADVSRVTLYSHFADKNALFEACVRREMERIENAQTIAVPDAPLRETLIAFGIGLMRYLASDDAIDFYSVLAGDLRRHPELARRFYDLGPGKTHANLTAIIERAIAAGELPDIEAAEAAEHLIGMWQGLSNYRLALAIEAALFDAAIPRRAEAAVDRFLAAYELDGGG